jgi:hypothetical protein
MGPTQYELSAGILQNRMGLYSQLSERGCFVLSESEEYRTLLIIETSS